MSRKYYIVLLLLINFYSSIGQSIVCSEGEYFWGIASRCSSSFPLGGNDVKLVNYNDSIHYNLVAPYIVSNKGRTLFSGEPITLECSNGQLHFLESVSKSNIEKVGKTLRQAYLMLVSKHMSTSKNILPPDLFFTSPVYGTRSLGSLLSQEKIEDFVHKIKTPGIIVVGHGWQGYNGKFDFDLSRFPDPKKMVNFFHSNGCKVMLQVTPLVSLDCLELSDFLSSKMLVTDKSGAPVIKKWYGGYSASLDLRSAKAIEFIKSRLSDLQSKYGIDGFSFTLADMDYYNTRDELVSVLKPWTKLAGEYGYNQIRGAYQDNTRERIVAQMSYYKSSWESLKDMLAESIQAGICGYPFVTPDVMGADLKNVDEELYIRSVQMQVFMPSMQFSYVPWLSVSADKQKAIDHAIELHNEMSKYIMELAKVAATTGEPIIRSMEYNFPGKGFYDCNDQFMVGARYLVAPIITSGGKRNVRLPAGTWIDDTGKRFKGPVVIKINADINRIPYFKAAKDIKIR